MNSPHRAQPAPAYSPRTERHRSKERGRLRLRDASAMAIGGMIGGGIFSVLGVTIELAGHLAFLCFVLLLEAVDLGRDLHLALGQLLGFT